MKRIRFITISLSLFLVVVLSGCLNPIFDENGTIDDPYLSYPNTVKSTTPPDGTGAVVVNSNIYITFYRPMNKSKTENAFSIAPPVAGSFSWPDRNVLKFTPTEHFKYDQRYKVEIAQSAEDTYGNILERSYTFYFSTPFEKPYVTGVNPSKDAVNVPVGTNIEITFSEDMDYTSVYNAFSISPSLDGVFAWDGTKLTFDPNQDLSPDTKYTVTISRGAKDLVGNGMENDYVFSFTTAPRNDLEKPYVKYVEVDDNNLLKIVMSERVLQQDAENKDNFSVDGGLIINNAVLSSDQTEIYLTTSNQVEGKDYNLAIKNIHDLAGNQMDDVIIPFKGIDPPDLISINPINNTTIEIKFSEPVTKSSAEALGNYFFTPYLQVSSATLLTDNQTVSLVLSTPTQNITYDLIVKNVMDLDGNTIKSNNHLTFQGIP